MTAALRPVQDMEIIEKEWLRDAAARLHALAAVDFELEIEIEDDEKELEIELKW